MLPRRNVRRMAPVWTASCVDSFESFERFERHTGFERSAVRFPLCRPLPSPHFHLLWTQQAILIICPVFGVHYISTSRLNSHLIDICKFIAKRHQDKNKWLWVGIFHNSPRSIYRTL